MSMRIIFNFDCKKLAEIFNDKIKDKFNINPCLDCEKLKGSPLETP